MTQYFNIVLFQEPIGRVRKDAECYILEHLSISRDGMYQLQHTISVPQFVSETFTGMHLGFSFCPDSVVLSE